ncbi:hypothetical protein N9Z12_06365, partial [Opitutaceae bacterium]|nr:hypothetical protein [Opitutaceae bacterium]
PALLADNGFDSTQHEEIRQDLREGRIGLAMNRLPATTSIEDLAPTDLFELTASADTHRQAGEAALANGELADSKRTCPRGVCIGCAFSKRRETLSITTDRPGMPELPEFSTLIIGQLIPPWREHGYRSNRLVAEIQKRNEYDEHQAHVSAPLRR